MPGKIDIGGYFSKLTKQGSGGRRIDEEGVLDEATVGTGDDRDGSGGITASIKDALRRSRSGAQRTADKVKRTAGRATRRSSKTEAPPESTVTIEYSPREDGDPDPGEVVWAWVPFEEDPSQGKDRPVVIIGRRRGNLVGIPLTTKADDREVQVKVGKGAWDPERRVSYARIWRLLEVDEQRMRREGCILEKARFDAIIDAVDDYYEVTRTSSASSGTASDDYDY